MKRHKIPLTLDPNDTEAPPWELPTDPEGPERPRVKGDPYRDPPVLTRENDPIPWNHR